MSRPEKNIDWTLVDQLLMAGCLGTEIAAHFDMHQNTFYARIEEKYGLSFTHYCQEKRSKGDAMIRAKQYDKALKGDNSMLIWLGKNRLRQRDKAPDEEQLENMEKLAASLSAFLAQTSGTKPSVESDLETQ